MNCNVKFISVFGDLGKLLIFIVGGVGGFIVWYGGGRVMGCIVGWFVIFMFYWNILLNFFFVV